MREDFLKAKSGEIFFREKKKRRRFKFFIFGGILFFFFVLIGGFYLFLKSDFLAIKKFEIKGVELSDAAQVRESIVSAMEKKEKWRSFVGSQNIIFWAFGKKPEFDAQTLPLLASLDIQTDLVGKKVQIFAKERDFFAVWCFSDNGCYGIDNKGVAFISVPEIQGVLLLKFHDENKRTFNLGEKVLPNERWLDNIFTTVQLIKASGLPISALIIKDFILQEWEARVYSDLNLHFSLNFVPENLEEVIKNLSKRLEFGKLSYLDFRVPNRIYYK